MNNFFYTALLLAALCFSTSIFCNDFDIFKEALTLSAPVEAQEQLENKAEVPDVCIALATLQCREQFKAFNFAAKEDYKSKAKAIRKCLWNAPCAQGFKKPTHLS